MAVFVIEFIVGFKSLFGQEHTLISNRVLASSLLSFVLVVVNLFLLRNQLFDLLIGKAITHLDVASSTRRNH
jgi:hypothetical protein